MSWQELCMIFCPLEWKPLTTFSKGFHFYHQYSVWYRVEAFLEDRQELLLSHRHSLCRGMEAFSESRTIIGICGAHHLSHHTIQRRLDRGYINALDPC